MSSLRSVLLGGKPPLTHSPGMWCWACTAVSWQSPSRRQWPCCRPMHRSQPQPRQRCCRGRLRRQAPRNKARPAAKHAHKHSRALAFPAVDTCKTCHLEPLQKGNSALAFAKRRPDLMEHQPRPPWPLAVCTHPLGLLLLRGRRAVVVKLSIQQKHSAALAWLSIALVVASRLRQCSAPTARLDGGGKQPARTSEKRPAPCCCRVVSHAGVRHKHIAAGVRVEAAPALLCRAAPDNAILRAASRAGVASGRWAGICLFVVQGAG